MKIRIVKQNKAVSEVLGTILLLAISVSIFSVVYVSLFSVDVSKSTPDVTIIGTIEDGKLILEHRGGESLDMNDKVLLRLNDQTVEFLLSDGYTQDDDEAEEDANWDIGERFELDLTDSNVVTGYTQGQPIDLSVVDVNANSMVMYGTVQEVLAPYYPVDILELTATMELINDGVHDRGVIFKIYVENLGDEPIENIQIQNYISDGLDVSDWNPHYDGPDYGCCYEDGLGIWSIDSLPSHETCCLKLDVHIISMIDEFSKTNLFFLVDGSNSISQTQYDTMLSGIAEAIRNSYIPHDETVLLSVLKMEYPRENTGGSYMDGPDIIAYPLDDNPGAVNHFEDVANAIETRIPKINTLHMLTPIGKGFMEASKIFNIYEGTKTREIVCLFTDGNPTYKYTGSPAPYDSDNVPDAFNDAGQYRNLLIINHLEDSYDRINVFEFGGSHHDWLKDNIIFPNDKGYVVQVPDDSSAVSFIETTLRSSFEDMFNERSFRAEITQPEDEVTDNNWIEFNFTPS